MSEAPKFAEGNWNPFASLASAAGSVKKNAQIQSSHGFGSGVKLKDAMQLNQQHHSNVMEHLHTSYALEKDFQSHLAGISETAAQGTHRRALELHNAIQKAAGDNTAINISLPEGGNVSYTRKPRRTAAAAPVAEPKPETEAPKGKGWVQKPEGAKSLSFASNKPAQPEKPAGLVTRDPKTGRAVSIKSGTTTPAKKSSKKSASVAGSSVGRDPKTGRAISLKK